MGILFTTDDGDFKYNLLSDHYGEIVDPT